MRKQMPHEPMDDYLAECRRLGIGYGRFQSICYQLFPNHHRPMKAYMDSSYPRQPAAEVLAAPFRKAGD